ncbi:hypothetical protein C7B70_23925 [Chlorogloea sp. CCALA 695]|nr:hypothetical protein C7B70_23925 [Chlorogloea sp. CCALA 695]
MILIKVLCNFSVHFGKLFSKKVWICPCKIQTFWEKTPFLGTCMESLKCLKALCSKTFRHEFCISACRLYKTAWTRKYYPVVNKTCGTFQEIQLIY